MTLQPDSAGELPQPELTSIHAQALQAAGLEQRQSSLHEYVCARRQIELGDQELRSYVVRHSVMRIHCVFFFVVITMALTLANPVRAELLAGALMLAGIIVAASMRNIGTAISSNPTEN